MAKVQGLKVDCCQRSGQGRQLSVKGRALGDGNLDCGGYTTVSTYLN